MIMLLIWGMARARARQILYSAFQDFMRRSMRSIRSMRSMRRKERLTPPPERRMVRPMSKAERITMVPSSLFHLVRVGVGVRVRVRARPRVKARELW